MKKTWYYVSLALTLISIIFVICITTFGFAKYDNLKSLIPMGIGLSLVSLVYLIWDILWIILVENGKIINDKSINILKYVIIILQIFTFASVYIGIAIGALLE